MKPKVRDTLNQLIAKFESGDIPQAVSYAMFPFPDVPSSKWSLTNRTLMFLSGTMNGRGYRQWQQVGRFVRRGSRAFYILVPYLRWVEDDLGEQQHTLLGFGAKPVFRVEDTDGEPLEYQSIEVPDFALIERAHDWGIDVRAVPDNYRYYGSYSPGRKEIAVATSSEAVFFHELAHCADHIIKGHLKPGQGPFQEIIAELAAQSLAVMVGKSTEDTTGNGYRYIRRYAKKAGMEAHTACLKVLSETEKVLNLILTGQVAGKDEFKSAA